MWQLEEYAMVLNGKSIFTPRQYHAAFPDRCFVCRLPFTDGIIRTHYETGAKTCSAMCFTRYQRWWVRPHLQDGKAAGKEAEAS